MPGVGSKSRTIIRDQFPEVVWEHSHVAVDDEGHVRTVCIYEGPSEEIILGHAEALGDHKIEGIYEIAGDVTPEDFPYLEQSA
jgi:Nickel responsive protein SCO4226-like